MRRHLKSYLHRHEPRGEFLSHIKSGLGAFIALSAVAFLSLETDIPMLIAPFGATAVLLFGQPASALAQPANVVGGYGLALIFAIVASTIFPGDPTAAVVAVGLSIAAMLALRVTHPPAGAVPLVAYASPIPAVELFEVVAIGSFVLVAIAVVHHLIPPRRQYPARID